MSKNKKLNLQNVKVESFITTLSEGQKQDAKGGLTGDVCITRPFLTYCFETQWPDMPC